CASIAKRGHGGDPLPGESLDPKDKPKDEVVETKQERGRALVVFTDGGDVDENDTEGKRTPEQKHTADGQTVTSKRDDAGMRQIAAAGGDEKRFFIAPERGEVDPKPIVA